MTNTELREKLVELLAEKCMATCKERKGHVCSAKYCRQNKEDCTGYYADHLIANGVCLEEKQATSDWISVEEMLPVPYVNVLVTRKSLFGNYRFVGIECITYNHGEARVWGNDHKGWKTEVTHWMLLPEPPKENNNA